MTDKIPTTKYSFDDLNGPAQLDVTNAVSTHRNSLKFPMDLGYPYAYWTGFDISHGGRCICIEFYLPETRETQVYHYRKIGDGIGDWEWWQ